MPSISGSIHQNQQNEQLALSLGDNESEEKMPETEHREASGYDDPSKAALGDNSEPPEKLSWTVVLTAVFMGTSFTGPIIWGFVFVTGLLVQLGEQLGGDSISFWIPSGWALAASVGFAVAGRLSDIFGRRIVLLSGQSLVVIGGIVACTAQSMNQLIAGCVILGSAAGPVSVAYAGISEILPNKYRGMGLAWTEFNLSCWAPQGTLLAYVLYSKASWRVLFYVASGYGAFSFIGTFFLYFPPAHPRADGKTKWQEVKELDFIGMFLYVVGLTLFLFGLESGGSMFPWESAGALVPLILGFLMFVGSFIYDFVVPEDPLFPWYLFKEFRNFSALLVLMLIAGMVFFASAALFAQTILYLFTSDPPRIGVLSFPNGFGQLVGGVFIPAFVHKIRRVHHQLILAVFLQTLFYGLAALVTPASINWMMASQFLAQVPFGWMTMLSYTTASVNVPQRDLGVAIGLVGTFRSIGGALGSAIFSNIFKQTAAAQVPKRISETAMAADVPSASIADLVESVTLTILGVPGEAAKFPSVSAAVFDSCVRAARYAYAYSFRVTWLATIPFGVCALVSAIFIRDPSRHFTNHVEIRLNKKIGGRYEG